MQSKSILHLHSSRHIPPTTFITLERSTFWRYRISFSLSLTFDGTCIETHLRSRKITVNVEDKASDQSHQPLKNGRASSVQTLTTHQSVIATLADSWRPALIKSQGSREAQIREAIFSPARRPSQHSSLEWHNHRCNGGMRSFSCTSEYFKSSLNAKMEIRLCGRIPQIWNLPAWCITASGQQQI